MEYLFNADDFGRTQTVNQAIVEGFRNNCLDRTTIMVNMPFFEEAVRLSEEYCFKDKVGLHINLTSGQPLTERILKIPGFCANGSFNGKIFSSHRLQACLLHEERAAIVEEIHAQIVKYKEAGFSLNHVDSHGHVHTFPSVVVPLIAVMKKDDMDSLRISANVRKHGIIAIYKSIINLKINQFNRKKGNEYTYFDSFSTVYSELRKIGCSDGICEIMLHPNIWDGDLQIGESLHYGDIKAFQLKQKEYSHE